MSKITIGQYCLFCTEPSMTWLGQASLWCVSAMCILLQKEETRAQAEDTYTTNMSEEVTSSSGATQPGKFFFFLYYYLFLLSKY